MKKENEIFQIKYTKKPWNDGLIQPNHTYWFSLELKNYDADKDNCEFIAVRCSYQKIDYESLNAQTTTKKELSNEKISTQKIILNHASKIFKKINKLNLQKSEEKCCFSTSSLNKFAYWNIESENNFNIGGTFDKEISEAKKFAKFLEKILKKLPKSEKNEDIDSILWELHHRSPVFKN